MPQLRPLDHEPAGTKRMPLLFDAGRGDTWAISKLRGNKYLGAVRAPDDDVAPIAAKELGLKTGQIVMRRLDGVRSGYLTEIVMFQNAPVAAA